MVSQPSLFHLQSRIKPHYFFTSPLFLRSIIYQKDGSMKNVRLLLPRVRASVRRAVQGTATLASVALAAAIGLSATSERAFAQNTKKAAQASYLSDLNTQLKSVGARVLIPGEARGDGMYSIAKARRQRPLVEGEYEKGAIYIKTRERFIFGKGTTKSFQSSVLMSGLEGINIRSIKPISPSHNSGALLASDDFGIGRIYEVQFEKAMDVKNVCKTLSTNPEVEYAEPIPVHTLLQTDRVRPRDPFYSRQYQWALIDAERAWAITRGDSNVVIAICDSGVDLEHEDLKDKIWNNPGEVGQDAMGRDKRLNGVDDDANGKVDDWRGWDFVGNTTVADLNAGVYRPDNNPIPGPPRGLSDDGDVFDGVNHGIHVAGIAAATTDNDRGGAGSGYLCRILAMKHSTEDPELPRSVIRGYEGILYAAQLGAKVVNCSWGGAGSFSQTSQDIVNAATNMGTLVVAAAGNASDLMDDGYFPGSYDNILSVGATGPDDLAAGFSNYGIKVTVFAPGDDILSTFGDSKYGTIGGTSMASPMTAGLAALVRTIHPDWTPRQVAQQIRATSDNSIQPGATERPFNYIGRINMYRALNVNRTLNGDGETTPGIILTDGAVAARNGTIADMEPKRLVLSFRNILSNANNVSITLTPLDPLITALQPTVQLGNLNTNQERQAEFTVQLQPAALTAAGVDVTEFVAIIRSGSYVNYERISIPFLLSSSAATPGLVVTPVVNYPTTPIATNATVRITNTGNQGLVVSNATITGTNAGEFSLVSPIDNIPLGAGEFITRQIRFTPTTGATGSRTATFNVSAISDGKASGSGSPISGGYTFSGREVPYQEITTTNSRFTRLGAGLDDEEFDVDLGFPFQFGTKTYTTIKLVSNGWIAFNQQGSSISETAFVSAPISDPSYSADGVISACGLDIYMKNDGTITHETQGTAPNRVFIAQWKNASFVDNPYAPAADAGFNFQIRLYEGSNRIEFAYGVMTFDRTGFTILPQVGLRGSSPSDFNNRRITAADGNNWTSSLQGTLATDRCGINTTLRPPATGYLFTYTPGDFAALNTPRVTAFTRTSQLNATARTGGVLGILPSITQGLDFGAVTIGTTRTLPITLANYSANPLTITSLTFANTARATSGDFTFVDAPPLPLVIPANSTRVLQVRYSPSTADNLGDLFATSPSPQLSNLRIVNDGVTTLLPLEGTGNSRDFILRVQNDAGVELTGGSGNFSRIDRLPPFPPAGSTAPLPPETFVPVGTQRVIRQYSLRNYSNAPITVTGGTFTLVTAANIVSDEFRFITQFPFTIPAATTQTLTIVFAPTQAGEKMVDMRIFSNEAAPTKTRLGSRGAIPASIVITPVQRTANAIIAAVPLGFRFPIGTVQTNTSATRTIVLTNTSTANMTVRAINFVGTNPGDFTFEGVQLPFTITPNATNAVVVRFRPQEGGFRTAQMTVTHNIGYGVEQVEVWGTGIAAKRLVSTLVLILPTVAPMTTSGTLTVNLTNSGRETVRITSLRIIGKDADQFSFLRTIPNGTTIATLRSSSATVFFKPTSAGTKEARVEITSDAENPILITELRGTAQDSLAIGTLVTADTTAALNSDIEVPILLRNARRFVPGATIYANLRVNSTLLQPTGNTPQGQVFDGQRVIPLTLQVPASTGGGAGDITLARLTFRTTLGTDTTTVLRLEGPFATGATLAATSGRLNVTGAPQASVQSATPGVRVEYSEQQGKEFALPILIRNRHNIPATTPMLVQFGFNASMLEVLNMGMPNVATSVSGGQRGITITVPRGPATDTTITFRLRPALGNATETLIPLVSSISLGYPNALILNQVGARFVLKNVNGAGGQQLFFSNGKTLRIASTTPNPANEVATIAFALSKNGTVNMSLSSAIGILVREEALGNLDAGDHTARISLGNLPSGTYLLTLRNGNDAETVTITIVR